MSSKNGKLMVCDRCVESIFLECIGEGEADGGYTRWNKFESCPIGWNNCFVNLKLFTLCPKCSKEFMEFGKERQ